MSSAPPSLADRVLAADPHAIRQLASLLLPTRPDNLVERPWGGRRLASFKGLASDGVAEAETPFVSAETRFVSAETRFGESFEIAADPRDEEASAHPSIVTLPDGSEVDLPTLLQVAGEEILGRGFVERHGRRIPLLPKFLDVHELLSVQAHPHGNPEAYVVVEADEGATLGLGFRRDVDAAVLGARLAEARRAQERLLELVPAGVVPAGLVADLGAAVLPHVGADANLRAEVAAIVAQLEETSAEMLAAMNAVPVRPGDVIDNSIPATREDAPTAEIHALGNVERDEILLLEVRKPGPSLRAWDHARFPPRPLDIDAALASASTRATRIEDFRAPRRPVPGRPGVEVSVACPYFMLEHLSPPAANETALAIPCDTRVRTLHVMRGTVDVAHEDGASTLRLHRGSSALLPVGLPTLHVARSREAGGDEDAQVLLVTIP